MKKRVISTTVGISVIVKGCATSCTDGFSAVLGPTTVDIFTFYFSSKLN